MDDDTRVAPSKVAMSTEDATPEQDSPQQDKEATETVLDMASTERVFLGVLTSTNTRLDRIGTGLLTLELLAGAAVVLLGLIVVKMGKV